MLTIQPEQMEAMKKYMADSFEDRMVDHLKKRFPERSEGQPDLRAMIRDGVARAENYGIEYEFDIRRYLECMLLLGRNFDREKGYPWVREILLREDLCGEGKMDEIQEYMLFEMDAPL